MTVAHDIYAETNPAFCAYALRAFASAYRRSVRVSPELPLAYLALPISLAGDFDDTFDGTNARTGLLEWLDRSPKVQVALAPLVNGSLAIVSEAISFGCFSGALEVDCDARLGAGAVVPKQVVLSRIGEAPTRTLRHAGRLGTWFANAGSTRAVFDLMGVWV